jgi:hypothetical protein
VEISNESAVSALGVTAERDGCGQLIVAVGDIHTADSFPDSLRPKQKRGGRAAAYGSALPSRMGSAKSAVATGCCPKTGADREAGLVSRLGPDGSDGGAL